MASRSHSWFDDEKLLRDERMVRSGRVRLRTDTPPYWWEGSLILTTDRLFFLPDVENPLLDPVAFWLADVTLMWREGRRRFRVDGRDSRATFLALGLTGRHERAWLHAIESARAGARPRSAFGAPIRRRAAG
jgi:hypothetical protein